jgi:hypothetical protein
MSNVTSIAPVAFTVSEIRIEYSSRFWQDATKDEAAKLQAAYDERLEAAFEAAYPDASVSLKIDHGTVDGPLHAVICLDQDSDDLYAPSIPGIERFRDEVEYDLNEIANKTWMGVCENFSAIVAA